MSRLLLVDKSAFVRSPDPARSGDDELCLCAVIRVEVLHSARSPAEYEAVEAELGAFRDLRMDGETIAIAIGAHRELATISHHGIPLPDLLIGACAQQYAADVLHVDRHYDVLARVLSFRAVRLEDGD
ncbi:MAG: PIN domain-containing protein [Thermoleophilaceae bacterium]